MVEKEGKPVDCPVVFADHLSIISVIYLCFHFRKRLFQNNHISYFGSVSRMGSCLLAAFNRIGLLRIAIAEADYFFGAMRTAEGEIVWQKHYYNDTAAICAKIRAELAKSDFIRYLGGRHFDLERLLVYYQKKALYGDIQELIIWINAVEVIAREKAPVVSDRPVLFIQQNVWHKYIKAYANECGIELRSYPSSQIMPTKKTWQTLWRMAYKVISHSPRMTWSRIAQIGRRPIVQAADTPEAMADAPSVKQGVLAVSYGGPHLSFDRTLRSDFYWWPESGFTPTEILLVFERPDIPLDKAMISLLEQQGIRYIAMDAKATKVESVPIWKPSPGYIKASLEITLNVISAVLHGLLAGQWNAIRYATLLGPLIQNYAYWRDFYQCNHVKAVVEHMGIAPQHIGRQLAMHKLGGVTFAHQYSFANRAVGKQRLPPMALPCANVLFAFSQSTRLSWQANFPPVEQFVAVGYIYDSSFRAIAKRALQRRKTFDDRGVEFVICYFDESSSDEKNSVISNEKSASTYEFLLRELIADETLGLVCKPKKPATLFQRISRIEPLIAQARATGRLLFFDEGGVEGALNSDTGIVNWTFPAEAGLMADIVIGDLVGGTAALEAYLAGTTTVLIDDLEIYEDPFYAWGRDRVVFDSWEILFNKLKSFRCDPASVPGFGDWSDFIDEIDPFRDGLAGKRVGQYLRSVFARLRDGESPEMALGNAGKEYTDTWGGDTIGTSRQSPTLW
jgi:hypothetical protein